MDEIPELSYEQMERLCEVAEDTARKHVLSMVPLQKISDIVITIDIKGLKPITVDVDLEVDLSPLMKDYDVQKLVTETVDKVFLAIEERLKEFTCKSKK